MDDESTVAREETPKKLTAVLEYAPWNLCEGIMADIRWELEIPELEA